MQLKQARGFTLIELTIAMALFSSMLLVMTVGVLRLYSIYNAGHEIRNTQEASRAIADDITRQVHRSDYVVVAPSTTDPTNLSMVCVFQSVVQEKRKMVGVKYYVAPHDPINTTVASLWRATGSFTISADVPTAADCSGITTAGTVFTSEKINVLQFQASAAPTADPKLLNVTTSIGAVSGRDNVLPPTMGQPLFSCRGGVDAVQCSITNLQTSALSRRAGA